MPQDEIRGLLFDKDGTLFDFNRTWVQWYLEFIQSITGGDPSLVARLADMLQFDLAAQAFAPRSPVIAGTLDDITRQVTTALPHRDPAELHDIIVASATSARQHAVVPLAPLLDGLLGRGIKIGLATNDAESSARAHLAGAGIIDRFCFIAGYDSGYGAKPEAGMMQEFLRFTGLAPRQVAMIGDSTHDLHSGRAAGMHTIAVLTGPAGADDLAPHADVVLDDIGQIPAWLDQS